MATDGNVVRNCKSKVKTETDDLVTEKTTSTPKRSKNSSIKQEDLSWAEICGAPDEDNMATRSRDIKIALFDLNNEEKFQKLVKQERIKSPFKISDVKIENPIVAYDPSIIEYKLATTDQSLEEGELEKTLPHVETSKRKLFEPRPNSSDFSKKHRPDSASSGSSAGNAFPQQQEETDPEILSRRQKQVDFGKNTVGYDHYISQVPIGARNKGHPRTPPMHLKYSRRAWDGMVKKWRIQLHKWDPDSKHDQTIEDGEIRDDSIVTDPSNQF